MCSNSKFSCQSESRLFKFSLLNSHTQPSLPSQGDTSLFVGQSDSGFGRFKASASLMLKIQKTVIAGTWEEALLVIKSEIYVSKCEI